MAQLKDTTITGGLAVSNTAQVGNSLTINAAGTGAPALILNRGAANDSYNDWQITDSGGHLYFQQRGSAGT